LFIPKLERGKDQVNEEKNEKKEKKEGLEEKEGKKA
jgi:hypothetical protein